MHRIHHNPNLTPTNFYGILTTSPTMHVVFDQIQRLARTDTPALIRGESGTGKELVAKALHRLSQRSSQPFEAINCATLRTALAASTLFGHVRGAFTGAVAARDGLFKIADNGTVFLDEIAELPLDVQAQLLRVLQERTFTPVGGTRTIQSDVRLIAATLQSLRSAVQDGLFREDLMYRIRVVPIFLPPLVERDDDVRTLTWHFVERFNTRFHRTVHSMSSPALDAISSYPWPGNVRELRNAIEHAFIMSDDDTLHIQHLPRELRGEGPPEHRSTPSNQHNSERAQLLQALQNHPTRTEAARALGISRTTLWRRLRELGID